MCGSEGEGKVSQQVNPSHWGETDLVASTLLSFNLQVGSAGWKIQAIQDDRGLWDIKNLSLGH